MQNPKEPHPSKAQRLRTCSRPTRQRPTSLTALRRAYSSCTPAPPSRRQFLSRRLFTLICRPGRNGCANTFQGGGLHGAPLVAHAWIPPLSTFFRKGKMNSIRATMFPTNHQGALPMYPPHPLRHGPAYATSRPSCSIAFSTPPWNPPAGNHLDATNGAARHGSHDQNSLLPPRASSKGEPKGGS